MGYLPDVWIYSDFSKGIQSQGYALSLLAECNNGNLIGADIAFSSSKPQSEKVLPEDLAKTCCLRLLDEISFSGVVDTSNQSLVLTLMALSERQVSSVRLGRVSQFTIENLRILKEFFGVIFKIHGVQRSDPV